VEIWTTPQLERLAQTIAEANTDLERFTRRALWLSEYAHELQLLADPVQQQPDQYLAKFVCHSFMWMRQHLTDVGSVSDATRIQIAASSPADFAICGVNVTSAHIASVHLGKMCWRVIFKACFGISEDAFVDALREDEPFNVGADIEECQRTLVEELAFLVPLDYPRLRNAILREFACVAQVEPDRHKLPTGLLDDDRADWNINLPLKTIAGGESTSETPAIATVPHANTSLPTNAVEGDADLSRCVDRIRSQLDSAAERFPHFRCARACNCDLLAVVEDHFGPVAGYSISTGDVITTTWFYDRTYDGMRFENQSGSSVEALTGRVHEAYALYSELVSRTERLFSDKLTGDWTAALFQTSSDGALPGVRLNYVFPIAEVASMKVYEATTNLNGSKARKQRKQLYLNAVRAIEESLTIDDYVKTLNVDPFTASLALIDSLMGDAKQEAAAEVVPTSTIDQPPLEPLNEQPIRFLLDWLEQRRGKRWRSDWRALIVIDGRHNPMPGTMNDATVLTRYRQGASVATDGRPKEVTIENLSKARRDLWDAIRTLIRK
jgi:hypothetical protein